MNDSFEVMVFLITMGMFMALIFLGVGIVIGREYEKMNKGCKEDGRIDEKVL